MYLRRIKIRSYEKGLVFKDKEFRKVLSPGKHWFIDPTGKTRVDIVSMRNPWFEHADKDLIISSEMLDTDAHILEIQDMERGLVWIDKRFAGIIGPGQHIIWQGFKDVEVELVDTSQIKFDHTDLSAILASDSASRELIIQRIEEGFIGVLFLDGNLAEVLDPGRHVFWLNSVDVQVKLVDIRENTLDVSGQDILTRDKVTLRLNGLSTYRVKDPIKAVTEVENFLQSLYRETQLALRTVVGTKDIDTLLTDKDSLAKEVRQILTARVESFGIKIVGFGVRDIILPGDMKELLNRVVESQKAAEADLIKRREETAAIRSQANTARILANNPTLMRLREMELLEKVAGNSNLNIVYGEGGLADKVVKLI